ncbi:Tigger transposable element-derived protein 6 [Eumeta japonica]|uniref:Tigger transposable element-derived protein 6 n=1 Tax=Eumeta variegata TaxID=151549 RepID=A0A4C1T4Y2_EUMVA|nr:Tigger transposable element-derived protein 6 [Eumeta japonica]
MQQLELYLHQENLIQQLENLNLLGVNAIGEKIPPLIVFKGKNVWNQWTSPDAYPNTTYAATVNGWMEGEVFESYFKKTLIPAVGHQRPILLIYDGHSTHVGLNVIEAALKENITILKLPAHTSHILQPLDIAVMKSFKDRWDPMLVKWQRMNIGLPLPKKEFSRLIGSIWVQIDSEVIKKGFKQAGIYPLNSGVIQESQFDILKIKQWKSLRLYNPQSLFSIVLNFINTKQFIISNSKNKYKERLINQPNSSSKQQGKTLVIEENTLSFEEMLLQKVKAGVIIKISDKNSNWSRSHYKQ